MTTEKKRKILYWVFKTLSILVSCFFPVWAVFEKFPVWKTTYGQTRTMGVGAIMVMVVVVIIFRKAVFGFIADKFNIRHAPPIVIWFSMLIVAYILVFIGSFMQDLTTVLWMGALGCSFGTIFTYVAENKFGKVAKEKEPDVHGE